MKNFRRSLYWVLVLTILAAIGCADMAYYGQAVQGHWQVWRLQKPLKPMLLDPDTSPLLQQRLQTALRLRDFASTHLALPDNDSYRSYADLGRPYVVHNIFAAPEFSLELRDWCFLLLGCVNYRGYFDSVAAQQLAIELREQGDDVYLAGITAYSTLGWFDDPLLNTFIDWPNERLAELLFHELAHQQLYISDDTAFNESFATAIGRLGTRLWLEQHATSQERAAYEHTLCYRQAFLALTLNTKDQLEKLYVSSYSAESKRQKKQKIIQDLQSRYQIKKQQWNGYAGYDRWFARDLNNAKLAALNTYTRYFPAFQVLFQKVNGDFPAFYQAVEVLGGLPQKTRESHLQKLLQQANPDALLCETHNSENADSGR